MFVLMALLLRLLPAHGMTASHCAPESPAAAVAGGAHEHHGVPATEDEAGSEECSHCPPADCAQHTSCEVPSVVSCVESPSHAVPLAPISVALHSAPDAWATTHATPPTRPPASSLA
jgi:hypothetical protein